MGSRLSRPRRIEFIDLGEDLARPLHVALALGRKGDAAGGAVEQPHAEPLLEPGDQLGDGGRRELDILRRCGETAPLGHPDHHRHIVDVAHRLTNLIPLIFRPQAGLSKPDSCVSNVSGRTSNQYNNRFD